ncbi:hypothetical protein OF820_02935 [Oceanotoga sp. DSM 15011]|jgi:hypothetical protein|uniref:Uncharacterized protein n=1 Tax=Oceanotoga teriensis TaxID=515440 RepID=A0AA45HJ03_9BACT|nr:MULTISPECIES: hypothetical protein [Oceanotoga]MDN5343085.1 hypothetical protein [Oceanotoga sp.]MDO7976705.1 hypothetical protein [Oceanotoga teriensis]PWJ95226.1 hypothetical protein C7380_10633 [Oceanotoga teriensis]UYP00647.1 hypothetical protein OF820_02935 [Oceanotoga sp. DSM 15011]
MNIYAGNPINSMEFFSINLILSTEPWSLNDHSSFNIIYRNNDFKVFNKNNQIEEKNILKVYGFNIFIGKLKEALDYNHYILSNLEQCDLNIFYIDVDYSNIEKYLNHISSCSNFSGIDSIIILYNKKVFSGIYYYSKDKKEYIEKNSIYTFFELRKNFNNKRINIKKLKEIVYKDFLIKNKTFKRI